VSEQRQVAWFESIESSLPCWQDYTAVIEELARMSPDATELPGPDTLQSTLPADTLNLLNYPIHFVPAASLTGVSYEDHIYQTGQVSTRKNSWHDLFNALVWSQFPKLKAAMNALHYREIQDQHGPQRGRLRDALTLWDESGVIVASSDPGVLNALAQRDWNAAFRDSVSIWETDARAFVCGHALLEKFLKPYKSITAHALLVYIDRESLPNNRSELLGYLDKHLAADLLGGRLIKSTGDLSPLPLAGIPGWWMNGEQDDAFYNDSRVFRRPPENFCSAPIFKPG
jgi:hypothetical protein